MRKIPFDSVVLAAVCHELYAFIGGKLQGARQPSDEVVVVELYGRGKGGQFLLSCQAESARAHFVTKRPSTAPTPPAFCATLRARLMGAELSNVKMLASDRVLEITFSAEDGDYRLIAELMGKHSNLILVSPRNVCVAAAKWVGSTKSSRPILSGGKYERPPVLRDRPDLEYFGSPAYILAASPTPFSSQLSTEPPKEWRPVIAYSHGAYPVSVAELGYEELPRESICIALEQYFDLELPRKELEAVRTSLVSQLNRVVLARETALGDLYAARDAGDKAATWQRFGELILAYGFAQPPGMSTLSAYDYDGAEVTIKIDPELDVKGNSNRYFEKAKKAKGRIGFVLEQIERLEKDKAAVEALIYKAETAERVDQVKALQELAAKARYTHQVVTAKTKEERPYEGHKIREFLAPGGYQVMVGETAEANDYLTMRFAKGNDWWLHIRGGTSSHVIIRTNGKPERVQKETLEFAAKLCVRHSAQKHATIVAVDYTLKKYVSKPRGSAKGSVAYNREKTLHVAGI